MVLDVFTIPHAVQWVKQGEVLAYPTEAVYGLGCDPFNQAACEQLLDLKQRPLQKGVILVAANVAQIVPFVSLHHQAWTEQVLKSWQNPEKPITWILPATNLVPSWISGGRETVAVRVTHHPQVKALCEALNFPLVSTSANLSSQPPIKSAKVCQQSFPKVPILEGELSGVAEPSQIWDAQTLSRVR